MSAEKLEKTPEAQTVSKKFRVKKKETIEELEYLDKHLDCRLAAAKTGIITLFGGCILTPIILKRLRFLRTTSIVRSTSGIISGVLLAYFAANYKRQRCMDLLDETYQYTPSIEKS